MSNKHWAWSVVFTVLSTGCVSAEAIPVENTLKTCMGVESVKRVDAKSGSHIEFSLRTLKAVGHCGCKSAEVSLHLRENDYYVESATVATKDMKLVRLSLPKEFPADKPYSVLLTCSSQ